MVSRNSQRNGAVRAWCRRAVEAEPLVSDLFTYRTEPGELADARYQDGRFASKGLRLVDRHRRHQSANDAHIRRRRRHASRACGGVLRAPGRREEGWRLGWVRNFQRAAGHFARPDALQHLRIAGSGAHGLAVSRRAEGGSEVDRKSTRLNSSHPSISYAVFCLKKKKKSD